MGETQNKSAIGYSLEIIRNIFCKGEITANTYLIRATFFWVLASAVGYKILTKNIPFNLKVKFS